MKIPMLDLTGQYQRIKPEIDEAIQEVLDTGKYVNGPQIEALEKSIAEFLGVKEAIAVASGSDALLLSLDALEVGRGDKVIVPTFTFFATAGAVTRLGATPIFVDIDINTYNIDIQQVEAILDKEGDAVKAVIPVHLYGLGADMEGLIKLQEKYPFKIVEDACQAINTDIMVNGENKKTGTIGDTGCFSFFPSKNLGGYGDGGMITTNDSNLALKLRVLRMHGAKPKYVHHLVGYNSRLDSIQAAVLAVKFKYLPEWTEKRRKVAQQYDELFKRADLQEVVVPELYPGHVFHQYVIRAEFRNDVASFLHMNGIETAVYYPIPLHVQDCFYELGYTEGDLPVSEHMATHTLALPIDPEMTAEQIKTVVDKIAEFYTERRAMLSVSCDLYS